MYDCILIFSLIILSVLLKLRLRLQSFSQKVTSLLFTYSLYFDIFSIVFFFILSSLINNKRRKDEQSHKRSLILSSSSHDSFLPKTTCLLPSDEFADNLGSSSSESLSELI